MKTTFKGSVSLILSDPLWKEYKARFIIVPFKALSDASMNRISKFIFSILLIKGVKVPLLIWHVIFACIGSLEITLSVPLSNLMDFWCYYKTNNFNSMLKKVNKGKNQLNKWNKPETEFKEFEPRLKYGWFHLKLKSIFQDLSRRSIETGFRQI